MPKRSKLDTGSSSKETEKSYIAKPLGDGSYRLEPEGDDSGDPSPFHVWVGGAIILLLIWWLFSNFFSNVFNLAVKRDFGSSQYWENIGDFHSEDKCYFFSPIWWLDDDDDPTQTVFVTELPSYPFTITTEGIGANKIVASDEHENFVKANFKHVLVDGRPPFFMKYRGSREVAYQIEGDKFLPLNFEATWSAVSIHGSSGVLHGYLLSSPDKLKGGSDSFRPGVEYELNTRDHRSLISYLKAEEYFGDASEKGDRYVVVFDDSCIATVRDRR
jgi:hypothetical protein